MLLSAAKSAPTRSFPLELETNLGGETPVSRLRIDLPKRPGIDVQVRIARSRMIEYILRIYTQCQVPGLTNLDALLEVRVEVPTAQSI